MVVEVRGAGGQTVFPGSLYAGEKGTGKHKGEPILWEHDVPPVVMDLADLTVHAGKLAAAAVLLRHWEGTRDNLAAAVCGVALRAGWTAEEADDFVVTIAEAAGDEEARDRAKAWRMEGKLEGGEGRVPGAKKLAEIIGKDRADKVVEWMSLGHVAEEVVYRRLSDIESKPIHWLWKDRIARGKVTVVAGHPGLGKSQLTASMASIVTLGGTWPVDLARCERGSVIILSAEDTPEDTIKPRFEAAGADMDRVYPLDAIQEQNRDGTTVRRAFNLGADIGRLRTTARRIGDVGLS
jgi:hypothetical protein